MITSNHVCCDFQANWFRASQYCRYHGMHLASISSQEENDKLEETIRDFGNFLFLMNVDKLSVIKGCFSRV